MYKILVEAHNLTEIQTEPTEFMTKSGDSLMGLIDNVRNRVQNFDAMHGFEKYSLTIHISRCK